MEKGDPYRKYIDSLPIDEVDKAALQLGHEMLHDPGFDSNKTIQTLRSQSDAGHYYDIEVDSLEKEHPHD